MNVYMICDNTTKATIKNVTTNPQKCSVDIFFHSKYACPISESGQQKTCPQPTIPNLDVYVVGNEIY
jgi:hypothetical protein